MKNKKLFFGKNNNNWKHGKCERKFFNCIKCGTEVTSGCKDGHCKKCSCELRRFPFIICCDCGKILNTIDKNRKRCRKCYDIWRFQNKSYCKFCGKLLSRNECKMCANCMKIPKNNPAWKNGITKLGYSYKFNKELKQKIRKRDNYICQNCNIIEEEYLIVFGRVLDVHHINYDKQNSKEDNLITLCKQCNTRANYNRDYWFAYYKYIINNKSKE